MEPVGAFIRVVHRFLEHLGFHRPGSPGVAAASDADLRSSRERLPHNLERLKPLRYLTSRFCQVTAEYGGKPAISR